MTNAEKKQLALNALGIMRGDDLVRARMAFKGKTTEQMNKEHGCSGRTCAEVLQGYEEYAAKVDAAIVWLKSVNA